MEYWVGNEAESDDLCVGEGEVEKGNDVGNGDVAEAEVEKRNEGGV